jgi:threonine/homoserine/homoserine lactone efflux protein
VFLRTAWRRFAGSPPAPTRFDSSRASFALGLMMALTSPWNIAFWLAAIARPGMLQQGLAAAFVVIGGVVIAALLWGFLWSGFVLLLRRTASGRVWDVAVNALTGLLMLYFATSSFVQLTAQTAVGSG